MGEEEGNLPVQTDEGVTEIGGDDALLAFVPDESDWKGKFDQCSSFIDDEKKKKQQFVENKWRKTSTW